jgi:hypothetical protein
MYSPTIGEAYESFDYQKANPMIPQGYYRPYAAGPRLYAAPLRQMKLPIQGFGNINDPIGTILGGTLDKAIETVVVRSMPIVKKHFEPELAPMRFMMTATLLIATVAAAASVYAVVKDQ